ncbi:EAL and modified HD-GYP domain-containing signal transduction protein [Anaerobranca californiensis DSM 14826]|jgi:EAL and modified HD-GYP domain-containing signal transduction protein|uniref:EAL and modified HD-GYP domain-containing signal transduction protein n=1 Tax=Anaerobranca californiensis DSM 14826 TaxID=1120989 RepID=A0A1M6LJ55_9FIRM|nr:EAL and modified HD-GYP domain-containing signal transduction protein [Anaerobranca californiensis DSM 14826]
MMEELSKVEPDFDKLEEIIQSDIGLTYRFLKLANSAFFAARQELKSVKQGLVRLGIVEIKKWMFLMLLIGVKTKENNELIKNSLIRGKMMELLAKEQRLFDPINYFLTGMFSAIDVLLNKPMEEILEDLSLDPEVKKALVGSHNKLREHLDFVLDYENLNFGKIENSPLLKEIGKGKVVKSYLKAIEWSKILEDI